MADEDVAVSVTKRHLRPSINSAWRSLSSLFIFYGMVATRGPVIYTCGMVDDTKQTRKSCNVRRTRVLPTTQIQHNTNTELST